MKKLLLRGGLVVVLLLVVALVAVFFSLNGIIKNVVQTQGTKATGVATTLEEVNLSPFSGALALDGFALANPEGFGDENLFQFNHAAVQVKLGSLLGDEIVVPQVHVDGAEVLVSLHDGKLNIQVLQQQMAGQSSGDAAPDATPQPEPKPEPQPDSKPEPQPEPKADEPVAPGKSVLVQDLQITNTKVKGELALVPGQPPLKIDLVLADIVKTDVRGAETADVIAFALDTILLNAAKSLADFSPDLDAFVGGMEDSAKQLLDDASKSLDESVPGAGQLLNDQGKKHLGDLFGGDKD